MNDVVLFDNVVLANDTLNVHTTIINVPSQFSTIQNALDAAYTGDTVLVDTGIYEEAINFKGKAVMLASNYLFSEDTLDIYETNIRGSQETSVLTFNSNESSSSKIIGFKISNGNSGYTNGAGISCVNSSPVFENMIVENCSTEVRGAGFYLENSNSVLTKITIRLCDGNMGGGIYAKDSRLQLAQCQIINNFTNK